MAHAIDEAIIEGFICPSCMAVFRTAEILHIHFQKEHVFDLGPANNDSSRSFHSSSAQAAPNYAFFEQTTSNQALGCTRSLTSELKQVRETHISREATLANTLLLRLEKLICIPPLNKLERREAEQAVVLWIDTKVDLCPSCGCRFGLSTEDHFTNDAEPAPLAHEHRIRTKKTSITQLTKNTIITIGNAILDYNPVFRRRHHCRLCGHVLCADCSFFLDRGSAVRLLQAVDHYNLGHPSGSPNQVDIPVLNSSTSGPGIVQFTQVPTGNPSLLDLDREPTIGKFSVVTNVAGS